ncbi:MAG TPA: methyltransferase domain-containing protein [Casimicrobiaceae bacterium]|nr:methyltransferase domain-containing protein [Casimicrobiaceae bacterium]
MTEETTNAVASHWARDDIYAKIVTALEKAGKPLDRLTLDDLAPVDHVHARGFVATIELADRLPIASGQHVLDIGCGLGGPARYMAHRFDCRVSGIDITAPFVEAANKLTALLHMENSVHVELGDGHALPYPDAHFDGAYTQHVTMNVARRPSFFAEAWRVLKPGGFFALTEHGLGANGDPIYPVPWSSDGSRSYLVPPERTRELLENAGFHDVKITDTGPKYLSAYQSVVEKADKGQLPALGIHVLMGESAVAKLRNAARNIAEGRTHPIGVHCRKPEA